MAAGEYVSVSSQSDTERADLDRERKELATDPEHEHAEMAAIWTCRSLVDTWVKLNGAYLSIRQVTEFANLLTGKVPRHL